MKYYRIQNPRVEKAITDFNDGKIDEIELCSIIYICHPYRWEHVVRWASESIDEGDLHDVLTVTEKEIWNHLAEKYGDEYLSRFKKPKIDVYTRLPFRLYIHVTMLKDVPTVDEDDPHLGHTSYLDYIKPKCVEEQIYYNYYDTRQEVLAKWDEKYSQYVKDILASRYYDGFPVYNVTMKIMRGDEVLKFKQYNIQNN